jgi:hypothetical protein
MSSMRSIRLSAAASMSSVIDSIAYEPANGSAVAVRSLSLAMTCWVRTASRAALVLGSASASSNEFVCSDCVPPSTPASASIAVRVMLLIGCCAVSDTPAVCTCVRISHDRGFLAPNVSRSSRAQIRRAARYLAISSKKSICALKKNDNLGAKSSMSSPRSTACCT